MSKRQYILHCAVCFPFHRASHLICPTTPQGKSYYWQEHEIWFNSWTNSWTNNLNRLHNLLKVKCGVCNGTKMKTYVLSTSGKTEILGLRTKGNESSYISQKKIKSVPLQDMKVVSAPHVGCLPSQGPDSKVGVNTKAMGPCCPWWGLRQMTCSSCSWAQSRGHSPGFSPGW